MQLWPRVDSRNSLDQSPFARRVQGFCRSSGQGRKHVSPDHRRDLRFPCTGVWEGLVKTGEYRPALGPGAPSPASLDARQDPHAPGVTTRLRPLEAYGTRLPPGRDVGRDETCSLEHIPPGPPLSASDVGSGRLMPAAGGSR